MSDILEVLKKYSTRFNADMEKMFVMPNGPESRTVQAMKYAVMNGGKRLRPFLVYETSRIFGKNYADSFATAASLEMLHTYSLIHDDLPAMDNDDLRRGKPTCHKQFDEATAILAGDGLLTMAFEVLVNATCPSEQKIELISLLSRGAGACSGMIAGQTLDLYAETVKNPADPLALISSIESMKTGCLLRYACEAGAVLGEAGPNGRAALCAYARYIGIAFQVTDDILDVEGDQNLVGKTLKKDQQQNKLTFVSCFGLQKAKEYARDLVDKAQKEVEIFGEKAENLKNLADFIIERKY